jgi:hypothetical protein
VGDTDFGDPMVWAKNENGFNDLSAQFEAPADACTVRLS